MAEKNNDRSRLSKIWSILKKLAKSTDTPGPTSTSQYTGRSLAPSAPASSSSSFSRATSEAFDLDVSSRSEIPIIGNDIEASFTNSSSEVPENALRSASTALKIGPKMLKSMSKIFSRNHEKGVDIELTGIIIGRNNIPINSPVASSSRSSSFTASSSSSSFTAPSSRVSGRESELPLEDIIVKIPTPQAEFLSPSGWSWLVKIRTAMYNLIKKGIETILPSADHPVFKMIKRLELAKHMLALSVPMVITFVTLAVTSHVFKRLITILISVAAALIMNGMLLSETYKRLASFLEMVGIVLLLSAFFAFASHILPGFWGIIPVICFLVSLTPFAIAFCCRNNN